MAHNSISPGWVDLFYTAGTRPHHMILPVHYPAIPVIGDEPIFQNRGGGQPDMSTAVDGLVLVLKALVPATTTFVRADAWYKLNPDDDPVWIYSYPVAVIGTNVTAGVSAGQQVMSFRSTAGGLYKMYIMEGSIAAGTRDSFPFGNAPSQAVATYLTGLTGWVKARDNGFPITGIWNTTKINDALRKKYILNA